MSNSGFDDPERVGDHGSTSGSCLRHSGHYVLGCAGAYGGNGLPSEQRNVCYIPFLNSSIIHQIKQGLWPQYPILNL